MVLFNDHNYLWKSTGRLTLKEKYMYLAVFMQILSSHSGVFPEGWVV